MKGQSEEEKRRILSIAGNPKNGLVERLNSIPNGYRILQRTYRYDPSQKRTGGNKKAIGVVIDDKYLTIDEYHARYTRHGKSRVVIPTLPEETTVPESDSNDIGYDFGSIETRLVGAVPLLYQMAVNCHIAEDLSRSYGEAVSLEILSLAIHWIQDRDNVARRFYRFSDSFALPFAGTMNEEQISQIYSYLGKDKKALSALFSLRCGRLESKTCVSYDSTSIPTKASDVYFQQTSRTKESEMAPMMHLALLVEQSTGMPVMYNLFEGKTPDCNTVEDIIARIEELAGDKDLVFVMDRGYETVRNLCVCSDGEKKCLMAARTLESAFITEVREHFSDFSDASSYVRNTKAVHGHTMKKTLKYRGKEFTIWVHVFRDDEKSQIENAAFCKQLDDFERSWTNKSVTERRALLSNPLMDFYKWSSLEGDLVRDPNVMNGYTENFGFFANISTYEMTTEDAYRIYHERDSIEKCFESGKMSIKVDTARVHHQDTMEGRFVVAFVALSILAELKSQLAKERVFEDGRKKPIKPHTFSVPDVIDITRAIAIHYAVKSRRFWASGLTKEVSRLCIACGVDKNFYTGQPAYIKSLTSICRNFHVNG